MYVLFLNTANCWVLWISKRGRQVVSFTKQTAEDTEDSEVPGFATALWIQMMGSWYREKHLFDRQIRRLMGFEGTETSNFLVQPPFWLVFIHYLCWRFSLFLLVTLLQNPSMH